MYEAFAARADRSAYGELVLAGGPASEKKNAYISATDDEEGENRAKEQTECPCEFSQDLFIERNDSNPTVLRILFVVFGEFIGDDLEL